MTHIFLTGFMGAGKTTVGRIVAERLGMPFVDLDADVEAREGREIAAIFADSGEDAFRCVETAVLAALEGAEDSVVACGGGIVLREENRALLRRLGRVFYLTVTAEEALARVGDTPGRPLLAGKAGRMAATLLAGRDALYAAVADETIDTAAASPAEVAERVERLARVARTGDRTRVVTAHAYDVVHGRETLSTLGRRVREALPGAARVALVTDTTVGALFGASAEEALRDAGVGVARIDVPAGEASKSWRQAGEVVEEFAALGLERTDAVVALGGGVVGDLAGFCAAVYLRGIPVVQAPTTLLAQVDSSIGGKTGVDLRAGKNLAGAFWQPSLVLTDTALLASLPESEWLSGLAEVVKTAILAGEAEVAWLEEAGAALAGREPDAVDRAVAMCVRHKAAVVSGDEREGGSRECLNLGHTLGHAIEKEAGFGVVPHGLAVAEGIRFAAHLARDAGLADETWTARQEALLDAVGLTASELRFDAAAMRETMASDKKVRAGRVRFALALAPGWCEVRDVDDAVLAARLSAWAGDRG